MPDSCPWCAGYAGHTYPVWVGEFGSGLDLFDPNPADYAQLDAAFIGNLSDLINDGGAYQHASLPNWNWWCWNANTVCACCQRLC